MVSLIIDNRERAIFPFLDMEIKTFLYEKKQLNTGDFLIVAKPLEVMRTNKDHASIADQFLENLYNIKACIERKTYTDFAASFRDGRYKSELKKMLELREKTNCQLFFIIEGTAFPSIGRTFARIPYVCILGAINKLMIRNNIFIIQTENEQHTARKLNELLTTYDIVIAEATNAEATNVEVTNVEATNTETTNAETTNTETTNTETTNGGQINSSMTNKAMTKRIEKTNEEIILKSWASLKGISLVLGKLLMEKFTIKDLVLGIITIEEIKTFKTAFGKTINKTAIESLLSIRNGNTKNCAKMLSAIVGITVDFATKLFKVKTLKEICQYYQTATDIVDYKFLSEIIIETGANTQGAKKVGPKKALYIYKLLNGITN